MAIVVSVFGLLIALFGLIALVRPGTLVALIGNLESRARFRLAIGIRVGFGALFIVVAPDCNAPAVVRIVGVIAIVAAGGILLMGRARLDAFMGWWLDRPALLRASSVFAIAFGALLFYAGP